MKYEAITPVQVFLSGKENTIYMLTKVTGTLTLDEIRNAEGFAVEIPEEDLEAAALPEPAEEPAEEPAAAPEAKEETKSKKTSKKK